MKLSKNEKGLEKMKFFQKQNYLKGTASFMIALILTLPIYSSSVLAVLSNGYIYGGDKIRGYTRKNEDISLNVTAWISGDSKINNSQVHLSNLKGPIFNNCYEKEGGSFYCTYQMGRSSIKENPFQIRVALYNDNDIFDSLFILNGAFDEIPPEINSFTISPKIVSSQDIKFNYDIYDHSYSATDTNRCSGIKKLELSHNGEIFHTEEINSQSNDCSASGTITLPINKINITEGVIEVILTAYDNVDQKSSAATQFEYDTQFTAIDMDSLEIKDTNGNNIDMIGSTPVDGVISFIVLSDDLDITKVFADISNINADNIIDYKSKKATCISYGEGYKCTLTNIQVKLSVSKVVHITINAADFAGNIEPIVLTKAINYDNTGPSVTAIKTNKEDSGISYVGSSATFIVELTEEGAGIDKDNIKMDLSSIKTGLSNKAADECTNSGSDWKCYWYNIVPDQSDGEKKVTVSGSDKLGNPITGTLTANIIIDRTPPSVISSEVNAVGVGVEAIPGYIKTNDALDITLKIKEKNKLRVYSDLSSFVTTQDNETLSCTKENEEEWLCELSSSQIDVPGHILGNINFDIIDVVGNNIKHKEPIEVFEYEDAVNVSYWTSKVICSPNLVDRQVTDLVNTRVYCSILLQPITPDQETLSINLGECTDNYNNSLGYIESIGLINAETGSAEPYLSIDLIKGEMTIDKLSFTCPLQIVSRVGTKINQNPEIEQVKVNIYFYNMPLGEYGKGIEARIQDAKDDAFGGIWKLIGNLKKIVSYARLVCNALAMLQKVKLVFQMFTAGITKVHLAVSEVPHVGPAMGIIKTNACVGDKTIGEVAQDSYLTLNSFCKFINCQMSPEPGSKSESKGIFGNIKNSIKSWNYKGNEFLAQAPGGGAMAKVFSFGKVGGGEGTIEEWFGKQPYQYMNARDNLLVAIMLGCIPGIINGLEKYRQIQCLYADCLEQNAYNNVPVKICEDQKAYATCKYIAGEIFAVLPWTALFDYYMGVVRSALADPITAIVSVLNVLDKICPPPCTPDAEASAYWIKNEAVCRGLQFAALLGEIINDVNGIIDDYEQIKADYCKRIKEDDND